MNEYAELILRICISIVVLLVLARLDGAKQVSQLTYYDYIVGITVGSIAGTLCLDNDIPIYFGLIAIVLFMFSSILVSYITNKSMFLRRFLTGVPIFLISEGEIDYKGLKRARFDTNDLLRELRSQGYFDVTEINFAILESNGQLSVMPKSYARPATVGDMELKIEEDAIKANVIIDGKILEGNLEAFGFKKEWLEKELRKQKADNLKDILLATLDDKGALNIYFKKEESKMRTSLM